MAEQRRKRIIYSITIDPAEAKRQADAALQEAGLGKSPKPTSTPTPHTPSPTTDPVEAESGVGAAVKRSQKEIKAAARKVARRANARAAAALPQNTFNALKTISTDVGKMLPDILHAIEQCCKSVTNAIIYGKTQVKRKNGRVVDAKPLRDTLAKGLKGNLSSLPMWAAPKRKTPSAVLVAIIGAQFSTIVKLLDDLATGKRIHFIQQVVHKNFHGRPKTPKKAKGGPGLIQRAAGMIAPAAMGVMNVAANPGNAAVAGLSTLGTLVGALNPAVGILINGVTGLTSSFMDLARGLEQYSASLFGHLTRFDYLMTGITITIAQGAGPAISRVVDQIGRIATSALPPIIDIINALAPLLEVILDLLNKIVVGLTPFIAMIGAVTEAIGAAVKNVLDIQSAILMLVSSIGNSIIGYVAKLFAELFALLDKVLPDAAGFGDGAKMLGDFANDTIRLGEALFKNAREVFGGAINNAGDAIKKFANRMGEIMDDPMGEKKKQNLEEKGQQAMLALFRAVDAFAHNKELFRIHGPQTNAGLTMQREHIPQLFSSGIQKPIPPPIDVSSRSAPDRQVSESQITPSGMPRPSPAAMHLHTADMLKIQMADEDRLHNEIVMLSDRIASELRAVRDPRYLRMMLARQVISRGVTPHGGN